MLMSCEPLPACGLMKSVTEFAKLSDGKQLFCLANGVLIIGSEKIKRTSLLKTDL